MTMQIAVRARDGFVLASDTKVRDEGDEMQLSTFAMSPSAIASSIRHESKVRINTRHQIAIATAGYAAPNTDVATDLDEALNKEQSLPADFAGFIETWAHSYAQHDPDSYPSLLIINSAANDPRIWNIKVTNNARAVSDLRSWLHPTSTHPATFWLQYFKCDNRPTIDVATRIAAATLLMGSAITPNSVGGLQIWQYRNDWQRLADREIDILEDKFSRVRESIDSLIEP